MEYLREINILTICLRFLLSLVIGGLLGLERGKKNRPAGLRTYMLVCLGATLVMMTGQYVFQVYEVSDPVRMGAQVISGIGFLGAGTIMVTGKNQIKGITTAAGLWTAACSGLAIGIGFYEGAIVGGVVIYFVMSTMQTFDNYVHSRSNVIGLYMEYDSEIPLSTFLEYSRVNDLDITDLQINKNNTGLNTTIIVTFTAKCRRRRLHSEMMEVLSAAQGVKYLEEI